ncbi:chromate efflux transporter [Thermoflexus sp.]|uniref:chromate efflux transporter n=1 Tax=Thermoflexus sp. TaxID=1969742 RepID=UPI00176B9D1C|nr:chromate efflux transporter [Thermoflexus sp.]
MAGSEKRAHSGSALEVLKFFLGLGFTAFGGPAAHIALMHRELVRRRRWVTEEQFLDLLSATYLIPGPNSTEMAIHLGFVRAGWAGLVLGGVAFIAPAMILVMALAALYVHFRTTPALAGILYGVKPVVLALIAQALWDLGRRTVRSFPLALTGLAVFGLYLWGVHELLLLVMAGVFMMLARRRLRFHIPLTGIAGWPMLVFSTFPAPFSLPLMFLLFLKIGAILYGSGYVLVAFLRADFVARLGWLTEAQLLDAVAIGQVTPGPVLTTATFIGYLLAGVPGALLATLGIFLPSFVFVALTGPLIPRMRRSPAVSAFLDGVNAASLGLMAGVLVQLAPASLVDPLTVGIGLLSLAILARFPINATWVVLAGAGAGLLRALI